MFSPSWIKTLSRHGREFARAFRNHHWERSDEGAILLSGAGVSLHGEYELLDGAGNVVRRGHNLITDQGANYLLAAGIGNGTVYGTWYLAPFANNVTPLAAWTAATFPATTGELTTQISESTRPAFVESVPASRSTSNIASPGTITAAQASVVIQGVGLLSGSAKGDTSGVLLSAYLYSAAYTLPTAGNTAGLKHTFSIS